MNIIALLVGVGIAMVVVLGVIAFPLYDDVVQYNEPCLTAMEGAFHLSAIEFVLAVAILVMIMQRAMGNQ